MRKDCTNCKHDDCLRNAICDDCYSTSDAPTKWEPAGNYKPDTNADRIRAMSDEELAEWLEWFVLATIDASGIQHDDFDDGEQEKLLAMLKQPAEVELV